MANNLRKFTTEAEYTAATLNYPSVAWVVSGDSFHYDKTEPTPEPKDKIILSFVATATTTSDVVLYNGGISGAEEHITSCTFNNVDVFSSLSSGTLENTSLVENTVYTAKIGINNNDVSDYMSGTLGPADQAIEVLFPAQIEMINSVPNNTSLKLVFESTTPPTLSGAWSSGGAYAYVPDASVNAYKAAWGDVATDIYPISEYSGNLPV